jgi:hypothetical protein
MAEQTESRATQSMASMRAFSDRRVVLARTDGDEVARFWDETQAGLEQADDGPTHLVIGRLATDERLGKIAARVGVDVALLRAFRDDYQMT